MSTPAEEIKGGKDKKPARVGFNDKGKPYPGVDKKTGERMSVSLEALQEEFGIKEGVAKYYAIARLEGETIDRRTGETVVGRYFFDPAQEGAGYRPELAIATLPEAVRKQVADIINSPQLGE